MKDTRGRCGSPAQKSGITENFGDARNELKRRRHTTNMSAPKYGNTHLQLDERCRLGSIQQITGQIKETDDDSGASQLVVRGEIYGCVIRNREPGPVDIKALWCMGFYIEVAYGPVRGMFGRSK